MIELELLSRFLLIGAIAFGGGQAALTLVERTAVGDTGWLTPQEFATGVGLAYATPGPVLILAPYVGYRVAGVSGALVATVAVFAVPVALAIVAAHFVERFSGSPRFRAFGRYAGAAAIGLLGVTLVSLARPVFDLHPGLLLAIVAVFAAERRGVSPLLLLAVAMAAGAMAGLLPSHGWPWLHSAGAG